MADGDAIGLHAVAAAQLAAQLVGCRVGCDVQRAARRVRDGIDDVRVRQLVPGRAREVEHVDPRERAAALLVRLPAELLGDLLVGHAGELPVVVEQAHRARHQPPVSPCTFTPESDAPLKNRNQMLKIGTPIMQQIMKILPITPWR